jgi:hypothetical protein
LSAPVIGSFGSGGGGGYQGVSNNVGASGGPGVVDVYFYA